MRFVKNAWYCAAWADDVSRALFPRKMLGEPVVFYRKQDGTAVAIGDVCPHRFAPLHRGTLKGDAIECGYHGLQFGSAGACVVNPYMTGPSPKSLAVKAYPLVERYGVLWIWMGEPSKADASTIPDYGFLTATDRSTIKGYCVVNADYRLLIDNFMDISHAQFVHKSAFEIDGFGKTAMEVTQSGRTVFSKRRVRNDSPAKFFAPWFKRNVPVEHWFDISFEAPGLGHNCNGLTAIGEPRDSGIAFDGAHMVTPETAKTTHYFYAAARNYAIGDPVADAAWRAWHKKGLKEEDNVMIEAVQRMIDDQDLDFRNPVIFRTDAGAMRVRRTIDRMIEEERPRDL